MVSSARLITGWSLVRVQPGPPLLQRGDLEAVRGFIDAFKGELSGEDLQTAKKLEAFFQSNMGKEYESLKGKVQEQFSDEMFSFLDMSTDDE